MKAIIALFVMGLMACAPVIDTPPTDTEWLNANPELEFGGCEYVEFETEQWGLEVIQQCWPDGYTVYQHILHNPIRMVFTGTDYSIRPMDNNGSIGLTLPPMTLSPGTYIIMGYGVSDVWGPGVYTVQAHCRIEDVAGRMYLGAHELSGNGPYRAMFTLNAPQLGVYTCSVYLRLTHADMTAGSYLTINRITVEVAPR